MINGHPIFNKYFYMQLIIGPQHLSRSFNFTIPPVENVGIFMSGGLDSAALLCLIINELKHTGRLGTVQIIAFTVHKPTLEPIYASKMIELISNYFNVSIEHNNNLENKEPYLSLGRMDPGQVDKVKDQYKDKIALYMGVNNMAPASVKQFNGGLGFVYKETASSFMPFINLYKPQLIDILYKLNVEFLIPYTHSCSVQPVGRCDKCYSCQERAWGFEELGLENPLEG
jgi:hypothetical protein